MIPKARVFRIKPGTPYVSHTAPWMAQCRHCGQFSRWVTWSNAFYWAQQHMRMHLGLSFIAFGQGR